jgi:hypothetical protein
MIRLRRVPINGWRRCVHEFASFESRGEFRAAVLLDSTEQVEWWLRNDPPLLRIPTPVGYFEPDFIYRIRRPDGASMCVLEIKGEVFWDGEGSVPRIKAAAAYAWVTAICACGAAEHWEFAAVLEQDACDAQTLQGMLANVLQRAS